MVSGIERGKLIDILSKDPYYLAEVESYLQEAIELTQQEREAANHTLFLSLKK